MSDSPIFHFNSLCGWAPMVALTTQQILHLIVVLLVVGGSFFSWLFKTMAEQRAKRNVEVEKGRRRLEMMRTGRTSEPVSERVPENDIAARRRAQLDALRQAQLEHARQKAAAAEARANRPAMQVRVQNAPRSAARSPVPVPPASSGSTGRQGGVMTTPRPMDPRGVAPKRTSASVSPDLRQQQSGSRPTTPSTKGPTRQQQPAPSGKRRDIRPPAVPTSHVDGEDIGESLTHRLVPDSEVPGVKLRPKMWSPPKTPKEWRNAMIMRELLAPPVSERIPSEDDRLFN